MQIESAVPVSGEVDARRGDRHDAHRRRTGSARRPRVRARRRGDGQGREREEPAPLERAVRVPGRFTERTACGAEPCPPVEITVPAGETFDSDDPRRRTTCCRASFGRPVRLEPTGRPRARCTSSTARASTAFADPQGRHGHRRIRSPIVAPGHVLRRRAAARRHHRDAGAPGASSRPTARFSVGRFRPNVVVAVDDATGFVENDWVGHALRFGAEVQASVFLAAPRCVMTTLAQPDLPRDHGVLQTIARHNRFDIPGLGPSSCVGVYALVTTGGTARKRRSRSRSRDDRIRPQPARLLRGRPRVGARRDRHGRRDLVLARHVEQLPRSRPTTAASSSTPACGSRRARTSATTTR